MGIQRDYYLALQISPDATIEEIKTSFRRLARQYHPDLNPDDPQAAESFKAISEAYGTLSDPLKRSRYDRDRHLTTSNYSIQNKNPKPSAEIRSAQYYYRRGITQTNQKQYEQAINEYSKAINVDPKFLDAYLKRTQIHYKLGDYQGVLDDCFRIISINPSFATAYYYQGRARYSLGYVQASIESYSEALRLDKDYAQAYYYRGIAYGDLKEKTLAIQDLLIAAGLFRLEGNYEAYNIAKIKIKNLSRLSFDFFGKVKYFLTENIVTNLIFLFLILNILIFFATQLFSIEPLFLLLSSSIFLLLLFLFLWSKLYKL